MQNALLGYIDRNFKVQRYFNYKHTAYRMKRRFTSTHSTPEYHVTSECFSEAMVAAGFRRVPVDMNASEPDWYFNARVPKLLKP